MLLKLEVFVWCRQISERKTGISFECLPEHPATPEQDASAERRELCLK
jgi:hypothetical protein